MLMGLIVTSVIVANGGFVSFCESPMPLAAAEDWIAQRPLNARYETAVRYIITSYDPDFDYYVQHYCQFEP